MFHPTKDYKTMKKTYLKPEMITTAIRAEKMICTSGPGIHSTTTATETPDDDGPIMESRRRNRFDLDSSLW